MNDQNSAQFQTPPVIPPPPLVRQLGDDPPERVTIPNVVAAIESILRHPRRVMYQLRQPHAGGLIAMMLCVAAACAVIYGIIAGTFSGGTQLWAAPVKITAGLMVSALICLPSLNIFTCLSGSQARLIEICGLLAGLLMLMMVLLIGFAPVAWVFSQSTESLSWMGALHLVFWFIATLFALRFLEAGFLNSNARSRAGLKAWAIIFVVVGLQMTTALRPIIGRSDTFFPKEKEFFMAHWSDCWNAPSGESSRVNIKQ
jgi:hypothetical protein